MFINVNEVKKTHCCYPGMEETSAVDWMLKKAEQETKGFRPWRKITRVNSYVECLVPQQNVRFEFHKLKNIFM